MTSRASHIFTKTGDARSEIEQVLHELGTTAEEAGFQKSIYVARADQTVVFLSGKAAALAGALRQRPGWNEPEQ